MKTVLQKLKLKSLCSCQCCKNVVYECQCRIFGNWFMHALLRKSHHVYRMHDQLSAMEKSSLGARILGFTIWIGQTLWTVSI